MPSAPDGAPSPQRVVEVKHGKRKVDIVVEGAATVAWLMEEIFTETGVLRKHQKLLCKGKQLVATETVDAQCMFKNGKTTVMLLASAGGGGAPPPPPTSGQQALAASRKAKFDAMVAQRMTPGENACGPPGESLEATVASRVVAWRSTGIVGMRELGLRTIPSEAFAIGPKARVADATANAIAAVPRRVAEWSNCAKLHLGKNKLTLESVDWEALATLTSLTHLRLDENDLVGTLPRSVAFAMPRLEVLALDGNRIASLPDDEEPTATDSVADDDDAAEKRYFPALERVSFARNLVTRLPDAFGTCVRLETIDASHNLIAEIPASLASAPRLRALNLDGNKTLKARGVPVTFLKNAVALDRLTFHGCDVEMETLRESDGWQTYDDRRKKRAGKVLESRVLLGDAAFDEGADVERRKRH